MTSTHAVGWTSRLMLYKLRHHNSWIWGSFPSKHWVKVVSLVLLLPGFEGRRMDPIGTHQIVFLVKWQRSEWVRQSNTITIPIKLIFKYGGKSGIWDPEHFNESSTFVLDSYWHKHDKHKNVTFEINSCWYKNSIPQSTKTTNGIVKTQGKRARTREPGAIPIIIRLIIKRI